MNIKNAHITIFLSLALIFAACGGGQEPNTATPAPASTVPPTATAIATVPPSPTEIPPVATATTTPNPTAVPTAVPTSIPTAIPTVAITPEAATPAPTAAVTYTTVDSFGFNLTIDGEVSLESAGLTEDDATSNDGILFFEYGGANSILLWFQDQDSTIDSVLSDNYTGLVESQPSITFALINEDEEIVDGNVGKTFAFVTTTESGSTGGGVIGAWRCTSGPVFALTVTGSDGAVVAIRFNRLLNGFTCSAK